MQMHTQNSHLIGSIGTAWYSPQIGTILIQLGKEAQGMRNVGNTFFCLLLTEKDSLQCIGLSSQSKSEVNVAMEWLKMSVYLMSCEYSSKCPYRQIL